MYRECHLLYQMNRERPFEYKDIMGCHCGRGYCFSLVWDGVAGCQGFQGMLELPHAMGLGRGLW